MSCQFQPRTLSGVNGLRPVNQDPPAPSGRKPGRPRKYSSYEDYLEVQRQRVKDRYYRKKETAEGNNFSQPRSGTELRFNQEPVSPDPFPYLPQSQSQSQSQ